ncbi:diaminopimelate epimerase [Liberibacter sp. Z1]|nr:diaminopimelate epimerase [Candidatus Liberibacter sp.]MBA5723948.1 diaminopimelate epimerase [Candidatus Liberibacter sp.]
MADFAKMEGVGNQILVVDMRDRSDSMTLRAIDVLSSCEDTYFDQVMSIHDSSNRSADAVIRIINRDGSEAQACGNGMRCVVHFLAKKTGKKSFVFETLRGFLEAWENEDKSISVDMEEPLLDWKVIPLKKPFDDTNCMELQVGPIEGCFLRTPSVVSMGNPHAIFFVDDDPYCYNLDLFSKSIEDCALFPEGVNLSVAKVVSRSSLDLRTWERGVGITAACGSAACAAVVSSVRSDRTDRAVSVAMSGGNLSIEWRELDNHVIMTGEAERKWIGKLDPMTGTWRQI